MSLTDKELAQFSDLGYVVKTGIYDDEDLQLLKDGLTGAIQEKCTQLVAEGTLDHDFSDASFETRLTRIHERNPDAAHEILMSIWSGRFHGPGILKALRHRPDRLHRKLDRPRYRCDINLSDSPKGTRFPPWRGPMASGRRLFPAALLQGRHDHVLGPARRCHDRQRMYLGHP